MLLGKNINETTSLNLISDETKFFVSNKFEINQKEFKRLPDNKFLFSDTLILLWNKCFENSDYLGNKNFKFYQGIVTGDNKRFLNDKRLDERYYPIVRGRNFYKYTPTLYEKYVLFEPELLHSNSNKSMFNVKEKLIIRQTSNHLVATYDDNQMFSLDSTHILFDISDKYNHKYLLALINSKLLNFLYQIIVPEIGKAFSQVKGVNLKKLPIKYISENKQLEFVVIVDKILKVKKEDIAADIQYLENKIDQMVYELYNLNTEEVKLINDSYSQMNKDKKVIKHIQEKLSL
ncbi:TaqI-like C-terminal specificity domain-containing protein [Aliarcobacter cryaerophilus]|uniref:TaqI-like C-terminal specificity domain-containing protein n=1 Tax=Aliarcobacter cryaerophilus TaxID=28198 RepID=UPI0036F34D1C